MKTNRIIIKSLVLTALFLGGTSSASAQFGNILGKAKDKVVSNAKHSAEMAAEKATDKAKAKAYEKAMKAVTKKVLGGKQLPELPWTMAETTFVDLNRGERQGMTNAYIWLMDCGDRSNQEVIDLRDKMFARYAANNKILLADQTGGLSSSLGQAGYQIMNEIQKEQERFWAFYGAIKNSLNIHASGIKCKTDHTTSVSYVHAGLVCSRMGGGFGVFIGMKEDTKKGVFQDIKGRGTYLDAEDLEKAKDCYRRVLNYGFLLEGVDGTQDDMASIENVIDKTVFGETGFDTDWAFETNRAAMYAKLLGDACVSNSPENLEKLPYPKAGSMNKSLKAKALAVAKAEDSSVIDVVITSNHWNVTPLERRSVSGYVIRNTKMGKQASGRSWCQDYMGGGRYGSLRNFGVGLDSFYIK